MKAPDFWTSGAGPLPCLLAPAGWFYGIAGKIERTLTRPLACSAKVICIGNLTAGGTGKTPVGIALARLLTERGASCAFLMRGYGGAAAGPLRVDPERMEASLVGDEALLLARAAPTWVARKRRTAINEILASGADHIILDDGYQDPALAKDVSLVVVDGATGFGNGCCIPAGPLREPLAGGLARADGVIIMGADRQGLAARIPTLAPGLPVFTAHLAPRPGSEAFKGQRVFAFAGIGRPEKFRETLKEIGAEIIGFRPFADHHPYRPDDVERLLGEAAAADAIPVTTAKDWVRLPKESQDRIEVIEVDAAFDQEAEIMALVSGPSRPSGEPTRPGPSA